MSDKARHGGQDVLAFKFGLLAGEWGEVQMVESKDLTFTFMEVHS